MPNLYATPTEIKNAMPNSGVSGVTTYDTMLRRTAERISRLIDRYCNRSFFPYIATRYFEGDGELLWLRDDCYSIDSVGYSTDYGVTFTTLTDGTDFIGSVSGSLNPLQSFNSLRIVPSSGAAIGSWTSGYKAVKVVGTWGYAEDRGLGWEDSQDAGTGALGTSATSVTVGDIDGADKYGFTPRLEAGKLIRMESEFMEMTAANTATNVGTIVRGVNGSTAASHVDATQIDIWKPPEAIKQACIVEAVRIWERAEQGFADARATADIGQLVFVRSLDPHTMDMLAGYVRIPLA